MEVCAELSGRASCFSLRRGPGKLGKLGNSQGCWGGELGPEEGHGGSGEGKPVVQESWAAGMVRWSENEEAGRSWGMLRVVSGGGGALKGPFAAGRLWWFHPHVPAEGTVTADRQSRSIRRQSPGGGIRVSEARDSLEPGAPASLWRGLGEITASLLLEGTQGAGSGNGLLRGPKALSFLPRAEVRCGESSVTLINKGRGLCAMTNTGLFREVTQYLYSVESKDLGPRSDFL